MTRNFCDWCKKEVGYDELYTINSTSPKTITESLVGLQACGRDEICIGCYRKMSDMIIKIKSSPLPIK
jgi:hypothetical protein